MVKLSELTPSQKHYIIGTERYCIRRGEVYDEVDNRFITEDDIICHKE